MKLLLSCLILASKVRSSSYSKKNMTNIVRHYVQYGLLLKNDSKMETMEEETMEEYTNQTRLFRLLLKVVWLITVPALVVLMYQWIVGAHLAFYWYAGCLLWICFLCRFQWTIGLLGHIGCKGVSTSFCYFSYVSNTRLTSSVALSSMSWEVPFLANRYPPYNVHSDF